jgi:Trk K+ transport system NAD-binding subunit
MYIIVAGAGKVGWNLARELLEKEHEVTVIESNRRRYLTVEQGSSTTSPTETHPALGPERAGSSVPTW